MRLLRIFFCFLLFFSPLLRRGAGGEAIAQRSKHGAKTIAALNTIVNEYSGLSANAAVGATLIKVTASSLNANGRFPGNLAPGDLIMIIQMQGATLSARDSGAQYFDPFPAPQD